jgi:hypothetical protein
VSGYKDASGVIHVSCTLKLFEGTSENTTQLDGQNSLSSTIKPSKSINWNTTVTNNSEPKSKDSAPLSLKLENWPT